MTSYTRAFNDFKQALWNNDNTGLLSPVGQVDLQKPLPRNNTILFLGDSFILRNMQFASISSSSFAGTQMTLTFGAAPIIVVNGSVWLYSQNLRGTVNEPLEGTWPIVSWSGSSVTVELGFDGSALSPGTSTVGFTSSTGDTGFAVAASSILTLSGKPITIINRGIGGDKVAHLRERLSDHIAAVPPLVAGRVCLLIGINDCIGTPTAINTILTDYDYIINTLLATGYLVDVMTVWPLGQAHDNYATATPIIKQINGYLRNKAESTEGITLIEAYDAIKDGANDYALAANIAGDLIHPSSIGALVGGATYATAITSELTHLSLDMVSSALDGYDVTPTGWNKLQNPLFSGTGGTVGAGVTGPVADNWTVNESGGTSCTVTYPDHPSGIGLDMQVAHIRSVATQNFSAEQDVTTQCPVGSTISCGCEVEIVADTGGHYLQVYASITTPRGEERIVAKRNGQTYAANGRLPPVGTRYWYETPSIQIPSDATIVKWKTLCVGGAIGTTTVKFGRPVVR